MMDSEQIKTAIDWLWGNTKRPLADAIEDLRDIQEHIDMLLDSAHEGED